MLNYNSELDVFIGDADCVVTERTLVYLICVTPVFPEGTQDLIIKSKNSVKHRNSYIYTSTKTPQLDSISPTQGGAGDVVGHNLQ